MIAFFCVLTTSAFTQNLMHSYGATISVLSGSGITLSQTSVCYFPRYTFAEAENTSFSVGLPVALGIGISNNAYGDAGVAFAYDVPAVLDYNIGCKSSPDNEATFGGYFGIGFGYYKINISKSAYSNFSGATYGPMARAGVRFSSVNETWRGHDISVGVFYKKGLETAKLNTIGFNVLLDL